MRSIIFWFSTLTIGLCLLGSGCGSSHGPDDGVDGGPVGPCAMPIPDCYGEMSSSPGCCPGTPRPATCVDDLWSCPPGTLREDDCLRFDPICEGFSPDAGGPPPTPGYTLCDVPSDCVVTANTCCGVCGRPTAGDVAAVNGDRQSDYYLDVACPEARAEPPICPGCASMPNASLVAGCDLTRTCSLVDIENDRDLVGCTTDDECIVRVPDCCECGADTSIGNLVAIHRDRRADLEAIVCDPGTGCLECAPMYPSDVTAVCASGLCRLVGMGTAP